MKRCCVCGIFVIAAINTNLAQDFHYSQLAFSKNLLNPSYTGLSEGDWRVVSNYRNQWSSIKVPFRTISTYVDRKFWLPRGNIGIGGGFLNDNLSSLGIETNKALISAAFRSSYYNHEFSLGYQIGFTVNTMTYSNITFPSQYDDNIGLYNPELSNEEQNLQSDSKYFDHNLGISYGFLSKKISIESGISFLHLNRPINSYLTNNKRLPIRTILFFQAGKNLTYDLIVRPSFVYTFQSRVNMIVAGFDLEYHTDKLPPSIKSINVGAYIRDGVSRNSDAVILTIGGKTKKIALGISYDINLSLLSSLTHYRGAFEFSVIYNTFSTHINQYTVPCGVY